MLKQIFPLLFTLIFSINLFAESHDIHKDILDIKLQIQEIKLTDARDDREKKIEKLEKDIKELEEKFNQNNIDKKDIEKSFDKNKDIIDRQDKRIEDIGTNLNYWGIGFSLIAIFTGIAVFLVNKNYAESAKKEALISVHKWIEENKDRILEPIKNEGNDLLINIRKKADLLLQDYQSTMKNHNLKNELDSKEKDILEKVNILLESKETENYTFNDWNSKFLDYFYKEDFDNAIKALDNALKVTNNEFEIISALLDKGVTLGMNKEFEKAIKIYEEIVEKFVFSKDKNIMEKVFSALINKIEINLILGNKNLKQDLDLYLNLAKENKKELILFEMLQIFEKAKEFEQDDEIKEWQIKFKDIKLVNWSFDELESWAETLEDRVKERILRYIEIFVNHN